MRTKNASLSLLKYLFPAAFVFILFSCSDPSAVRQRNSEEEKFIPTDEDVQAMFQRWLPTISDGLELNAYSESLGEKGYTFVLADLNKDGLMDALVDYSLLPSFEMNGGGGNAIGEISGLVYFKNDGTQLVFSDHTQEFPGNFGSRNELYKVENGIIFLKKYEYTEEDGRCCQTIPYLKELEIIEGKCSLKEKPYPISE